MTSFPYLIAIALIEQEGTRAMPIGGKSLKRPIVNIQEHQSDYKNILLELLIRVFQKTEFGRLRRDASENSLLLIELPLEVMQKQLPSIKSEWIKTGNKATLFKELKNISNNAWTTNFRKHEGITVKPIE